MFKKLLFFSFYVFSIPLSKGIAVRSKGHLLMAPAIRIATVTVAVIAIGVVTGVPTKITPVMITAPVMVINPAVVFNPVS